MTTALKNHPSAGGVAQGLEHLPSKCEFKHHCYQKKKSKFKNHPEDNVDSTDV
jgi:hypothetical protein